MATTPLITLLLTILLDGEKLTLNKSIGVVFGLSGVLLLLVMAIFQRYYI